METFQTSNQINLQGSSVSGNLKLWGGLQLLIIHFERHFEIINFISLIFYKDAYLFGPYIVIPTDAKQFFPKVLFYCFTIIVHISQT